MNDVFITHWSDNYSDLDAAFSSFEKAKKNIQEHAERLELTLVYDNGDYESWAYYCGSLTDVYIQRYPIDA